MEYQIEIGKLIEWGIYLIAIVGAYFTVKNDISMVKKDVVDAKEDVQNKNKEVYNRLDKTDLDVKRLEEKLDKKTDQMIEKLDNLKDYFNEQHTRTIEKITELMQK